VGDLDDLARELDQLRCRAALGTLKARVSLTELAGRVDLPRSTVHTYVNGTVLAPSDVLDRIVIALGATPGEQASWNEAWFRVAEALRDQRAQSRKRVPRQLPMDIPAFTGRSDELAQLSCLAGETGSGVVVAAITGTAGVGKTALAVHAGHRVADRFPDGQLYLDLRGYSACPPMTPGEALGSLLRGLGMPADRIPASEQEQAASFRSLLVDRKVLVVLDNARSSEQVEPLLPGGPGCLVIVTSRTVFTFVDCALHLQLDVLDERDALALLIQLIGADRVAAEPENAAELVDLCARLPLAIRIAGARLAARSSWSITTMLARLANEQQRLDELQASERAIRSSFATSYRVLADHPAGRLFRLLGTLDWVEMSVPVAAALLDLPQPEASVALERLVDDHLLESAAPDRYRVHDLLRLYSKELAEPCADAVRRAMLCYLAAAEQATRLARPTGSVRIPAEPTRGPQGGFGVSTAAEVNAWTEAEQANLLAIARQVAAIPDLAPYTVRLASALDTPLNSRGCWPELVTLHDLAATVAHRTGDTRGEAYASYDLGWAYGRTGRSGDAIAMTRQALALFHEIADPLGEIGCLNSLGSLYRQQERFDEAAECKRQGLIISQEIGYRTGMACALDGLGLINQRLHRFDEAIAEHRQAMAIYRSLGETASEATATGNLGWAHHRAGQPTEAIEYNLRSAELAAQLGDRYQEAESLWGLGESHRALSQLDQAREYWQRSITILHELGELTDDEAETLRSRPIPTTPAAIQRNT
jgi:tetratricopeptide (TPR) repeat protein